MAAEDERLRDALLELDAITRRLRRDCPGTASRTSAASCRTRSRRRTSWPMLRTRRRRQAARRAGRRAVPGLLPLAAAGGARRRATSPRSRTRPREAGAPPSPHLRQAGERPSCPPTPRTPAEVKQNWDAIKQREPGAPLPRAGGPAGADLRAQAARGRDPPAPPAPAAALARPWTQRVARSRAAQDAKPRIRRAVRGGRRPAARRSSSWPPTPASTPRSRCERRRPRCERNRARARAADPRLARQPDRRGRGLARVGRARARRGARRAPPPASSRRSSCATAATRWGGKGVDEGRRATSTARSPRAVTGARRAGPGARSTAR